MLAILKKLFKKNTLKKDYIINYNPEQKFVFIHIPKNAGTSIAETLKFKQTSHATIKEIQAKLGKKKFKQNFKFCFVRNPWSRFLSLYNYARMLENEHHSALNPEKAKFGKHTDYDLLKDASLEECATYLIEGKLKHDHYWNHWQPQKNWVIDNKGKVAVDFIGRIENLEDDFHKICQRIGVPFKIPNIKNASSATPLDYRKHYNSKTRNLVGDFYQKDIEFFNYKF